MTYPPFKHFTLMEQTPTTASDSAATKDELVREIAWLAWLGAANAYRLYPENAHTFGGYWHSAKDQFKKYTEQVSSLQAEVAALKEENAKWQSMCDEFVGSGPMADEFRDEPHKPHIFGNYVRNINEQLASKDKQIELLRGALKEENNATVAKLKDVRRRFPLDSPYQKEIDDFLLTLSPDKTA